MKLSQLLEKVNVIGIIGNSVGDASDICYDSRRCTEGSLFVAIAGLTGDGHAFIPHALAKGARLIVHESDYEPPPGITAIKVENTRRALGILGKNFYRNPSQDLCLIAVTGTNGKTTVTYLLEGILEAFGAKVGVLGTVNYRYQGKALPAPNTTPESLEFQRIIREMSDAGVTHVIAEVSSHAVDLLRVDDCLFDLGIFTNLSRDHLDYHGTMERYFQAKLRFFKEILPQGGKPGKYKMIINGDDPWGQRIVKEASGPLITYGMEERDDVWGEMISLSSSGIEVRVQGGHGSFDLSSPFIGRFNAYNILAAVAASFALGVPEKFIREGIADLKVVPGRLERVSRRGEPSVFVDYAHTSDALTRVLQNLSEFRRGRIITVFGCGGDRDRGKRPLMGSAATTYSDVTIITSDNPRGEDPLAIIGEIEAGVDARSVRKLFPGESPGAEGERQYIVEPDRKKAIALGLSIAASEDTVLVAGKGHENYQIIGDKRLAFDDCELVRRYLDAKRGSSE